MHCYLQNFANYAVADNVVEYIIQNLDIYFNCSMTSFHDFETVIFVFACINYIKCNELTIHH